VRGHRYNNAQEIDVAGPIFTLGLDDHNRDYDAAEIKPEMKAIVGKVVASFLLSRDRPHP